MAITTAITIATHLPETTGAGDSIYCELTAAEVPCPLVSVTLTFVTAEAAPCVTLKGTFSLNWPPVAFDAVLLNHVA